MANSRSLNDVATASLAHMTDSPTVPIRDPYQWGGPSYPEYAVQMNTAGAGAPAAPAAAPGGGGGAPAGSPPAPGGTGGTPATAPGTGTGSPGAPATGTPGPTSQPAPTGDPNAPNLDIIRGSHDFLTTKLGGRESAERAHAAWTNIHTQAQTIGKQLGYTEDSITAALADDPYGVMSHLQTELRTAQTTRGAQPQLPKEVKDYVDRKLSPFEQAERERIADKVNATYDSTFNDLLSKHETFKDSTLPKEVKEVLYDMVSESLKYDDKALQAIMQGKTSDINKYFDAVTSRFLATVNSYNAWVAKANKGQNLPNATEGAPNTAKLTTDDIIFGTPAAEKVMSSMRTPGQ